MFGIAPSELILLLVVGLVFIGPKDLPKVMRVAGRWIGRARAMTSHFRSGIDEFIRQSELEEVEAKRREGKEREPLVEPDKAELGPTQAEANSVQQKSPISGAAEGVVPLAPSQAHSA